MFATLRSRAWVSSALIIIFIYLFYFRKKDVKNYKSLIIISAVLGLLFAYSQFDTYFISSKRTPRSDLLKYSIVLGKESFPIGTGFAPYGSNPASKYYSVLYNRFHFYNYFGMSKDDALFLNDNFWPIVIAELGFIGVFFYILLIINIFKFLLNKSDTKYKKIISLLIFINLVFSSTVSASFVHYSAVCYMAVVAYVISSK